MELYLHIPFCRSKCRYCDFASWAGGETRFESYAEDVAREAQQRACELGAQQVETVFIGGGTPSVLPTATMARILDSVFRWFSPADGAEFTSEANPGTLTKDWLETLCARGLNRLSMGMQASQGSLLRTLGRIHTMDDVRESVRLARDAGIRNLNLDLMFGLPGQSRADWRETLGQALALSPQHLSCYGLIPEPGTPLAAELDSGRLSLPEEDEERAMYDDALTMLAREGFVQYEISNFALPGFACRHNIGYWRRTPYLGLGLSAASMFAGPDGSSLRETNPRSFEDYSRTASERTGRETERVSPREVQFEMMMLGLRMNDGVSEKDYFSGFGTSIESRWGTQLAQLTEAGLVYREAGRWKLTRRGMDVQNSVLVELMDDENE